MESSSISFGSITSSGGTTRLSGTNSNIDTDALVNSLTDAKKLPAIRLENRITVNDTKVAALQDLRTYLSNIQSAVEGLRNPPGALGQDGNLFEKKAAFLSSDTTTSPAAVVGVAASNRAQPGSFKLVVEQLATAAKLSSASVQGLTQKLGDQFGSFTGSIELGLAGGATTEIAVDSTMTIQDVRNAINSRSATTGVTASVLQVDSGDVRLVLTAKDTGKAIVMGNGAAGGDDVLATLGLSADGGTTASNPIQDARSARFSIDGVQLERLSNKVDDVLQGVTLNLFKGEPGTTVTVEVERSLSDVETKITDLVDAYNAFRDFAATQNQVSAEGSVSADSPLFGNSLLRDVQTKVASALGGSATGVAGTSLSELGITLDGSNRMKVDQDKLDNALLTRLDRVRDILEFKIQTSSADLSLFARSGPLQDTQFKVDIVDADNDGQIDSATIDGVAVDVSGKVIKGREGTPYAGLQFIWAGTGNASIDVTASQGIADRAYDDLSKILDLTEGRLQAEIGRVQDDSVKAQSDIDKINERADRYRDQLIIRFSALETALGQAQSLLQQIKAAFGKSDNN